jgi:hypothetical protein
LDVSPSEVSVAAGSIARVGGSDWYVRSAAVDGTGESTCPEILILTPARTDDPEASLWVANLPGGGFHRLDDRFALGRLLSACPQLPPASIARLVAVNLGPGGAEAVVVRADQLDPVLGPESVVVPRLERLPRLLGASSRGWDIEFIAYRTYHSAGRLLADVAAWRVTLDGEDLHFVRRPLVEGAPFPRR